MDAARLSRADELAGCDTAARREIDTLQSIFHRRLHWHYFATAEFSASRIAATASAARMYPSVAALTIALVTWAT